MPDGTFGHKWDCMKAVGNMIAGGVLERYPGLHVVLAEAGVGWIPSGPEEFDYYQVRFPPSSAGASLGRQRDIPLKPSAYIDRQVYGAFISDKVGCRLLPEYGLDNFLWSNDYPHGACIWPQATAFIAQDLGHLTPEARAKVLSGNVARLYNDGQAAAAPRPGGGRQGSGGVEQGPLERVDVQSCPPRIRGVRLGAAHGRDRCRRPCGGDGTYVGVYGVLCPTPLMRRTAWGRWANSLLNRPCRQGCTLPA